MIQYGTFQEKEPAYKRRDPITGRELYFKLAAPPFNRKTINWQEMDEYFICETE